MKIKYVALILENKGLRLVEKRPVKKHCPEIECVFPGGKIKSTDISLEDAIKREAFEELGIKLLEVKMVYEE